MSPEAIAAMHGTGSGGDEQRPTGVFLQQARLQGGLLVGDWISREADGRGRFGGHGQHLPQQGIVRIAGADASQIGGGHKYGELHRPASRCVGQFLRQPQPAAELVGVADRVAEVLLPCSVWGSFPLGNGADSQRFSG
jgi:hypothetical protein